MKISFKIGLANFILVLLIIILGSTFVITEQRTINRFNDLAENNYPLQILLKDIQVNIQGRGMSELSFIVTQDTMHLEMISHQTDAIKASLDQAKTLNNDIAESERIEILEKDLEEYLILSQMVENKVKSKDIAGAQKIHYGEEMMAIDQLNKDVSELLEHKTKAVAANIENIRQISTRGLTLAFTISIIFVLLAALSWLWLTKTIVNPLRNLTEVSSKIANGDLSLRLNIRHQAKDEVQLLSNHFGIMVDNLRGVIQQVQHNVLTAKQTVDTLAIQMEGAQASSEEMAASIEEVAGHLHTQQKGIEDIVEAVNRTAEGIIQIEQMESTTLDVVRQNRIQALAGNETNQRAIDQMGKMVLQEQQMTGKIQQLVVESEQIQSIVEIITGLAAQTNLLALNAAIEAARAGSHGQGFAVVAEEVRKLAEQSANSAKEIALISSSIRQGMQNVVEVMQVTTQVVEQGMESVRESGEGFEQILNASNEAVTTVEQVNQAIQRISAEAQVIEKSIQEISLASRNVNQSAEQIQAGSQEEAAAMVEITTQIQDFVTILQDLKKKVDQFIV
ncbi:methyl-accepting chemotaxis protein [Desulfitobacterium dichloroeliminans LMG P-21439]|uniref:Methyl-accepting chemotaxis protein n=1 Tax=Desulfitobacterium dichloroeliminans (strain LMG P-21439 / DCA1) TaxID=871963 RepID=L0F4B2_DESDL|nr:HAMP domain-containing methyl-accepting chemotaxis protein [Desulfitobacterium dichloroeliminans]AGA68674.1 methyl-accepting chemotaxis protein [Desulfitobacterium dichloroeliminans LMG P-21439]